MSAPQTAIDNGHAMEWDPPAAITSAQRWTCAGCGATAIRYNGNEYGSATEKECSEAWCDCDKPTATTPIGSAFPHKVRDHLDLPTQEWQAPEL